MSRLKVIVAHNRYASAQPSGENTVVDDDIERLAAAGVTVLPYLRSSDEIRDLPFEERLLLPITPIHARRAQRELAALITAEHPDVLHLHNPYPLLSAGIVATAHRLGVPVVQTVHNYRHVCISGQFFRDGRACTDCRGKRVPYDGVLHACYRDSRAQSTIMATALAVHRHTWRSSVDRYIAPAPVIAEHLRTYGVAEERIMTLPNAVPDPGRHESRGRGFLLAARFTAEKGLGLLLDAWRRHEDEALGPLRLMGDGPLRGLVDSMGQGRRDVEVLGLRSRKEVSEAIREAAVVVVPSLWPEPLPTVALEALANARPVLGTNVGGLPYVVGADAGWIVEPTVEALTGGLRIARDQAEARAAPARRRYEEEFLPGRLTERLLDAYARLSRRRSDRGTLPDGRGS